MIPSVRLLTLKDAKEFHMLRLRACKESPGAFLESYEELAVKSAKELSRYFDNGWIAGAFMDKTLVGMAGLFRHRGKKVEHKGTVWGVYMAPEARGAGLARKCIESVLDEAKKAGLERIIITTDVTNEITKTLYQGLGFEPWGVEKHILKLPDGSYVDDVVMAKSLI